MRLSVALGILSLVLQPALMFGQSYTVTPIVVSGSTATIPTGLSQDGWVVGRYGSPSCCAIPWIWKPDVPNGTSGSFIASGFGGKPGSVIGALAVANGINGGGITHYVTIYDYSGFGYLWQDGVSQPLLGCPELNFFGPYYSPRPDAVNGAGEVAGATNCGATFWTSATAHALVPATGEIFALNDNGVGTGRSGSNMISPFGVAFTLTSAGQVQYIPMVVGAAGCTGYAINNNNEVAGQCDTNEANGADPLGFAYIGGQTISLCPSNCYATGMNNKSVVAGTDGAGYGGQPGIAMIWDQQHGIQHLGDFLSPGSLPAGVSLTEAVRINDAGQVVTLGSDNNAYLLTPVPNAATSTSVGSSANPSVFGQAVTITSTVSVTAPGTGTPAGTVSFSDGATLLGTSTLSGGQATFSASALSVGPHSITAAYGGMSGFNASTSAAMTQTVNPAATSPSLVAVPNPSVYGQPVTMTATLSVVAPGAGVPTGNITFSDGTSTLATVALSGNQATFTTSSLAVGSHNLIATYSGDSQFNSSVGSAAATVNPASTTTAIASSMNPSVFGQSVTFTAAVSVVSPGIGTPTGTVTFADGITTLGSAGLSAGQAVLTVGSLSVGTHQVTASYVGSPNFAASSSPALLETIKPPPASIPDLVARVTALNLNAGEKNSLIAKLDAAQDSINRGNRTAAANELSAFVNEVEALEKSGRIDATTAGSLIVEAQAVIGQI